MLKYIFVHVHKSISLIGKLIDNSGKLRQRECFGAGICPNPGLLKCVCHLLLRHMPVSYTHLSIISYIELMKTEPDLPPHMQDYLKIVSQKADRLRHMLQDIFDVSKAATGNITLMPEYIGLDKLLRQTLGDMDGVMNDSELTWRVQIPQEEMCIRDSFCPRPCRAKCAVCGSARRAA